MYLHFVVSWDVSRLKHGEISVPAGKLRLGFHLCYELFTGILSLCYFIFSVKICPARFNSRERDKWCTQFSYWSIFLMERSDWPKNNG